MHHPLPDARPGGERHLGGGLVVRAAYAHEAAARHMVHELKYRRNLAAADALAVAMAPLVPRDAAALVPVPRALGRRLRYGIDPAAELAHRVGRHVDLPALALLLPGIWWPRHAGRQGSLRSAARFRAATDLLGPGIVLVDDVVTSGATLRAASLALSGLPAHGITATSGGTIRGEADTSPEVHHHR